LVDVCHLTARTGTGVPALLMTVERWLDRERVALDVTVPSARGDLVAWLHRGARILDERYEDGVAHITALATQKMAGQIRKRLQGVGCSTSPTR
jgi:GTP-binding protein HflX